LLQAQLKHTRDLWELNIQIRPGAFLIGMEWCRQPRDQSRCHEGMEVNKHTVGDEADAGSANTPS
jgi:hypothetical protein